MKFSKLAMIVLPLAVVPVNAFAITQSITANIAFDAPLSMTKNSDINFGVVRAGINDVYTISTAGVVTAAGAGGTVFGTPTAGNITISGSTTQTIDISAGSYTANNGVTPSNARCAYNGGASAACSLTTQAAPGAGKTLLVGVDATVTGSPAAGATAAPTFVITVVYN